MWPQIWQGDKIEYFSIVFFSLKHLIFSTSALTASSMMTKTSSSFTAQGAAYAGDHTIDIFECFFARQLPIFVRVGGRENYFHCNTCDMCLPNHLYQVPFLKSDLHHITFICKYALAMLPLGTQMRGESV